jgi:hypothetical protein
MTKRIYTLDSDDLIEAVADFIFKKYPETEYVPAGVPVTIKRNKKTKELIVEIEL